MYDPRETAAYFYMVEFADDENAPYPDVQQELHRASCFIDAMEYVFTNIEDGQSEEEIMTVFYDAGKAFYGKPRLREFFKDIYLMLSAKTQGSRIGVIVYLMGVNAWIAKMQRRMVNPLLGDFN